MLWPGKRKAWLGLLLFFPLGALWLVSFYKPVYVVGRYDLVAYPAYALLMGLALRKLQRVKPGGPLLALCVALLLVVPIGAKLFRYYRAPSEADARETAAVLDTAVSNGDVVVFTGLRGLRVLYYLYRLDYRWQDGYCQNELAGRRFACRMYPRETEERPAVFDPSRVLTSPDAVDEDVREFLRMRRPPGGSLWVVFASGSFSHGDLHLPGVDTLLVENLQRLGLQPVPVPGARGIFRFQQS